MICRWCKKERPQNDAICPKWHHFPNENKIIGQVVRDDGPNDWSCNVNNMFYPIKNSEKLLAGLHERRYFVISMNNDDTVTIHGPA